MYLLRIVCALVVASISTGVLGGKSMCASFQTDSKTASLSNGSYLATLTFSVNNTCTGESSHLKSIKVVRDPKQDLNTPTCHVLFNHSVINCPLTVGCTCDSLSRQNVLMTKTIGNVQGETWLLVGELENKDRFNETVEIRPGRMPTPEENTSLVVGLAASAGILAVILFLALVAVCYLQKRRSGAWPLSLNRLPINRRPAHRDPNATLPRQPTSPAVEHGDQQDGEQSPSGQSQCMFYSDNYEAVKDSLVSL